LRLLKKTRRKFNDELKPELISRLEEKLTPYAVEIKYPGILSKELTIDKAKEAVELCTSAFTIKYWRR